MLTWIFYLLPFISALIGWIVAKIAVSAYISILLKRRAAISSAIGDYAAQQFSFDALEQTLTKPESIEKILPFAEAHIDNFLRVKLPAAMPMLAMFISDKLVADMKGIFMNELKELFPALIQQYLGNIKKDFDLGNTISTKLNTISTSTLRPILVRQLRIAEVASVLAGFLCGCFYIFLTWIA